MSEVVKNKQSWYKSPWVIGWLLLIMIVLSVNGFMIFKSIGNDPGLVVDDFYERGQNYEENIAKKLENNLKWNAQYELEEITVGNASKIVFRLTDQEDRFKQADTITLFAYRPADARQDFSNEMNVVTTADGRQHYEAEMTFQAKGVWDLLVGASVDGKEVNYAKRIFVKEK